MICVIGTMIGGSPENRPSLFERKVLVLKVAIN